jgi:excisionase family DNA binding protein
MPLNARDRHTPCGDTRGGCGRGDQVRFFTIAEVAELVGVSARTVRRWIQSGRLVAHRVRGVVRISPSDLEAFLCQHRDV